MLCADTVQGSGAGAGSTGTGGGRESRLSATGSSGTGAAGGSGAGLGEAELAFLKGLAGAMEAAIAADQAALAARVLRVSEHGSAPG